MYNKYTHIATTATTLLIICHNIRSDKVQKNTFLDSIYIA